MSVIGRIAKLFGRTVLLSCAGLIMAFMPHDHDYEYVSTIENPVWEETCYWTELATGVACGDLKPARVLVMPARVMDQKFGRGVRGFFYPMGTIVYVRSNMSPELIEEVILHEGVHYILDRKDPLRRKWHRCASEEAARLVTDLYKGRPYSSKWKEWYNCPKGISPFSY